MTDDVRGVWHVMCLDVPGDPPLWIRRSVERTDDEWQALDWRTRAGAFGRAMAKAWLCWLRERER